MQRDLVNATLMTSAFEIRLEERTNDIQRLHCRDKVRRQTQHVRIVMLTSQLRQLRIPAQGRTDTLMLVRTHTDTVTRRADHDTELVLALLYGLCKRVCKIRIIATLGVITAEILYLRSVVFQKRLCTCCLSGKPAWSLANAIVISWKLFIYLSVKISLLNSRTSAYTKSPKR